MPLRPRAVFIVSFLVLSAAFANSGKGIASSAGKAFAGQMKNEVGADPVTATARLQPYEIEPQQIVEVQIRLQLLEGYKAYEDQFKLVADPESGFQVARYSLSPVHEFFDEFSKKKRSGVVKEGVLTAAIGVPKDLKGKNHFELRMTYQACTKDFCLFPKTIPLKVQFAVKGGKKSLPAIPQSAGVFEQSFEQAFARGLLWTFLIVFLAGILTSFTPCIFPMIPITLAVLAKDAHHRSRRQSFLRSLCYVLGISVTYSVLGVLAASTGALFGSAMSSPWVLGAVCLVFLIMAISLFGFFELEVPQFIQRGLGKGHSLSGFFGAFVTGLISGIVASPCVGPVLVGILAYVAQTQNLLLGFSLLFVFALGMGQIFLAMGLFTNLSKQLPKSGPWLAGVKHVSALLMLGAFYYHLDLLIPTRWFDLALGLGMVAIGSLGGAFEKTTQTPVQKIRKGGGWAALLFGVFLTVVGAFELRPLLSSQSLSGLPVSNSDAPSLQWQNLTDEALAQAQKNGKPVLIDFYADWCAACHELDRITFTHPRVQQTAEDFVRLRFDATNDSAELQKFKQRYGILGLPWVVLIDSSGEERKDLTLTAFEEPILFLERMNKARASAP